MDRLRAAVEVWDDENPDIGYLTRLLTQTNLPYRDPGPIPEWTRRNGVVTLMVEPGRRKNPDGTYTPIYPYGILPRLLLIWMSSQAVKTRSHELVLGTNLTEFMGELGLRPTGGKTGTITRLRDQAERLLKARLSVEVDGGANRDRAAQISVALHWDLFWNDRDDGQEALLPSTIVLSRDFYQEIINHPVPLNMAAIAALRGSPMRLDIYAWLTWRMSYLSKPTVVSWEMLMLQFGSNLADTKQGRQQFRRDFAANLREVLLVYREANVEVADSGLRLRPSRTHIPFRGLRALAAAGESPNGNVAAAS
ncbi:replication protein RepA [Dactylosporangium sucinum]|uniref:Plasmid replication protein n=1 Tax=Dactylosporangium sucinum TaxID=1424081 RepID=A0A917TI75_9ACTN|nr:replication protein RepA [Dactylosporangium sucinum]GGM23624.1 plasmid replication protein [Dactylosporangium sucinum]